MLIRAIRCRLEQAQALVHVQEAKSLLDATCSAAHAELVRHSCSAAQAEALHLMSVPSLLQEHQGQQIKVWEHQHLHDQG